MPMVFGPIVRSKWGRAAASILTQSIANAGGDYHRRLGADLPEFGDKSRSITARPGALGGSRGGQRPRHTSD